MEASRFSRVRARCWPYALALLATLLLATWFYRPWDMPAAWVFGGGEDIIGAQVNIAAAGAVGPFGTDPHLAWPDGYNMWSFPQLGLGALFVAWLLAGPIGLGSGASELVLMIFAMCLTSVAALFFIRSIARQRLPILAATFATAIAISPLFAGTLGHVNVAFFYLVPLALGVLVRGRDRDARWWIRAAIGLAVLAALAPLWWAIVVPLLLAPIALGTLLRRRYRELIAVAVVGVSVAIGLGFQLLLFFQARIPGAQTGRNIWDSNSWGGRLADLLIASPLLNHMYPQETYDRLRDGASLESGPLGVVLALSFVAALLMVIKGMPWWIRLRDRGPVDLGALSLITIVSILFFITGGLGNAQAALAVLVGGSSPARTWSRMSVLVALCGMAWLLAYLIRWVSDPSGPGWAKRTVPALVGVAAAGMMILDLASTPRPPMVAPEELPEYAPVQFLEQETEPCPVAQLPQDGAPEVRIGKPKEQFYYRGYYYFLLAPNYFWSLGSWIPGRPGGLNAIGPTLTPAGIDLLRADGFCAIVYDKDLARVSENRHEGLEGTKREGLPAPDLAAGRYDVYLLRSG